ncbi:MAG: carboxypeptidase-like regulatory domain-containing protein [Chloroflexota bacterium]
MTKKSIPFLHTFYSRLPGSYRKTILLVIFILAVLVNLSACNLPNQTSPSPSDDLMASIVASTLQALTGTIEFSGTELGEPTATGMSQVASQTPGDQTPTLTPTSSKGKVTGLVCYLDVTSTDLVVYFQNTTSNQVSEVPVTVSNYQVPYTTELEPGTYKAYAWTSDFSIGGTYSVCGTDPACKDATPKPFTIDAGQTIENIDLCDWSHGPFDVPYPPGFQPEEKFGIISGGIFGYPYGGLPQLTIVAFNNETGYWFWIGTVEGQSYFTLTDLPSGTYQVVAYDSSGHAGGTSVDVVVKGGQTSNADLDNWSGSFPPNPLE